MTTKTTGWSGRPAAVWSACIAVGMGLGLTPVFGDGGGGQTTVMTTINDYIQPGTQPNSLTDDILTSSSCINCHGFYPAPDPLPDGWDPDGQPYDGWVGSMMAQAARDPIWQAAVNVANFDAANSGEICIRCHAPKAWLEGRSTGGDLSALIQEDYDGINCHFCHRAVRPFQSIPQAYELEDPPCQFCPPVGMGDPDPDAAILADLVMNGDDFTEPGNGRYVVDPVDVRRGPFDDIGTNWHGEGIPIHVSPFHQESLLCATCHDVSPPTFMRDTKDPSKYNPTALDAPHPTQNPHDMFPEQRTYSEWLYSDFTTGVVFPDGRFGGNLTAMLPNMTPVSSCQDCHMPDADMGACGQWPFTAPNGRPDMPRHFFLGANNWVQQAVLNLDTMGFSGLTQDVVDLAIDRNEQMLRDASDMVLTDLGGSLNVRVINQSGHKLPTGYPEGRRMWLNVKFYNALGGLLVEYGVYDDGTGAFDAAGTKVYEAIQTFDDAVATASNLPAGTHFHLALNNVVEFDNRIPPAGWDPVGYELTGASPVGVTYTAGENFDDTVFPIPHCAARVESRLYYQTTTKEYAEFLRDSLGGTNAEGIAAYDQWVLAGKSSPVEMDFEEITSLTPTISADTNADGLVDVNDLNNVILAWGTDGTFDSTDPVTGEPRVADANCDRVVDVNDLMQVIMEWSM